MAFLVDERWISAAISTGHGDGRGTVTAMKLQDFLDHVNNGAPIEGGSEQQRLMHDAAQQALRITPEINTGYRSPDEVRVPAKLIRMTGFSARPT